MDWDPSLAYTAVIYMRPALDGATTHTLTEQLTAAMTAANPKDRWAFSRTWLDEHSPASCTVCGANLTDGSGDGNHGHWQNCTSEEARA